MMICKECPNFLVRRRKYRNRPTEGLCLEQNNRIKYETSNCDYENNK